MDGGCLFGCVRCGGDPEPDDQRHYLRCEPFLRVMALAMRSDIPSDPLENICVLEPSEQAIKRVVVAYHIQRIGRRMPRPIPESRFIELAEGARCAGDIPLGRFSLSRGIRAAPRRPA